MALKRKRAEEDTVEDCEYDVTPTIKFVAGVWTSDQDERGRNYDSESEDEEGNIIPRPPSLNTATTFARRTLVSCVDSDGCVITLGGGQLRKVASDGAIIPLAGVSGEYGNRDGLADQALFSESACGVACFERGLIVADGTTLRMVQDGVVTTVANSQGQVLQFQRLTGIHAHNGTGHKGRPRQFLLLKDKACVKRVSWGFYRTTVHNRTKMLYCAGAAKILAGCMSAAGFTAGKSTEARFGDDSLEPSLSVLHHPAVTTFASSCGDEELDGVYLSDCTNRALRYISHVSDHELSEVWNVDLRGASLDCEHFIVASTGRSNSEQSLIVADPKAIFHTSDLSHEGYMENSDGKWIMSAGISGHMNLERLTGSITHRSHAEGGWGVHHLASEEPISTASLVTSSEGIHVLSHGQLLRIDSYNMVPPSQMSDDMLKLMNPGLPQGEVVFIFENEKVTMTVALLCARSAYFANLFSSGMQESSSKEIIVDDVPIEVFKALMTFVVLDKLESKSDGCTLGVMVAADKYQLLRLKSLCDRKIHEALSSRKHADFFREQNGLTMLQLFITADRHNFSALRAASKQVFVDSIKCKRFSRMFDWNDPNCGPDRVDALFEEISTLPPALAMELFKSVAQAYQPDNRQLFNVETDD